MNIKQFILRLIFPNTYSQEAYLSFLRKKGIDIGK